MDISSKVKNQLESLSIENKLFDCDPQFADTAEFCKKYGFELADSANAIVVASKKEPRQFVACIVLADSSLDVNSKVRKAMEVKKLSFASGEDTVSLTGMEIGGVTPFALPSDLRIWIDEKVFSRKEVVVGGGTRDLKVILEPNELLKLPNAEQKDISKS